jgi:uncharacterized membrane protein
MKFSKLLLLAFLFACIGITTEIFFTAFYDVAKALMASNKPNWSLTGKTYVWMFLIYATIPFFLHFLYAPIKKYNIFIKGLIGVILIFAVEFASGWALEKLTGKCPWEYTEGYHIMGYIRLDYAPFWFVFAVFVILLYEMLQKRLR